VLYRLACSKCCMDVQRIYCFKHNRTRSFAAMEMQLFVCGYTHSPSLSVPKCFASALLQVIDRIETLSFEICDLSRSLAAEESFSAWYPD
jgi:hypothetical protein